MSDAVIRSTEGRIGILTINNPPVNALAAAVRAGIKEGVEAFGRDPNVDAIVLIGGGRTFIAGADIREFGKPPSGPNLNDVIATMENSPKLIVAALHGTPLGGGLETALGAHYRVSLPTTRMGLPEVHLGLLPGAGGTQRLPRLTGAKYALDAILSGRHIPAAEAKSKGIVDAIVEGDLLKGAIAHAEMLLAQKAPLRRVRDLSVTLESPELFAETEKSIARKARGFKAPWNIIKTVQAAVELPFDEGMKRERELFTELLTSSESAAQRYYFFAEREAAKVKDVPADTPQREIRTGGIIGAGTMGGGIAMNFANAGVPVTLLETSQEALDRGLKTIRTNYENTARRGGMKAEDVEKRMALIKPTLNYDDLKDADVIIEAVFETWRSRRRSSRSWTRSPSRAPSWPPTPPASTSTRSPPTPAARRRDRHALLLAGQCHEAAGERARQGDREGRHRHGHVVLQEDRQDPGAGRRLRRLRRQPHAAHARRAVGLHDGGRRPSPADRQGDLRFRPSRWAPSR
jgi:3-hydroxyacyl-CoA dehydrogenase